MDIITLALAKKYTQESLEGAGALKGNDGKSAYEVAKDNGFSGTELEWLASLKGEAGIAPSIGDNGHWFVGETDTGINAQPEIESISIETLDIILQN